MEFSKMVKKKSFILEQFEIHREVTKNIVASSRANVPRCPQKLTSP